MMKNRFGKTGKHRKLTDDWSANKEPLLDGVTFSVKYLGMCSIDLPNDEVATAEAVKQIVAQSKSQPYKVQKVSLTVSPKGIKQVDLATKEEIDEVSIFRISYCTADKNHDKVFGYITKNIDTDGLECHAFQCLKRKQAEELTLSVARSFNIAFECFDDSNEQEDLSPYETGSPNKMSAPQAIPGVNNITNTHNTSSTKSSPSLSPSPSPSPQNTSPLKKGSPFSLSPPPKNPRHPKVSSSAPSSSHMIHRHHNNNVRVGKLLDEMAKDSTTTQTQSDSVDAASQLMAKWGIDDSNLDDSFSKLAQTRSNPGLLDTDMKSNGFNRVNNSSSGTSSGNASNEELLCL